MSSPELVATAASLAALDAAYRAASARTSLAVVRALLAPWRAVDPTNLAGTSEDWLRSSVEAILAGQRSAAGLANEYTNAVRRIQVPGADPFTPAPIRPPNAEQVRSSIEFVAVRETARNLNRVKSVRDGSPADEPTERESSDRSYEGRQNQIMEDAIARAAGSAIRYITTAGRDQIEDNVRLDGVALGWARVTKPGCCYFCAMLASRGYVYKDDSFNASNSRFKNHPVNGVGDQKVHDNCGCGLRPVFSVADDKPERMEEFEELWENTGSKYSGSRAILEFRRAYEGRLQVG